MRKCTIQRSTTETQIILTLNLDGQGNFSGSSNIGFLDHMLNAFTVHSGFDLSLQMTGDLNVDCHHSVEDLGIVLGQAFQQILTDKNKISRYGSFYIPMDETLAFCAVDIGGRPFWAFDGNFNNAMVGKLDCCMVPEFFRAFAMNAYITLHAKILYGENDHHKIEAIFKSVAHALRIAVSPTQNRLLSSKGVL